MIQSSGEGAWQMTCQHLIDHCPLHPFSSSMNVCMSRTFGKGSGFIHDNDLCGRFIQRTFVRRGARNVAYLPGYDSKWFSLLSVCSWSMHQWRNGSPIISNRLTRFNFTRFHHCWSLVSAVRKVTHPSSMFIGCVMLSCWGWIVQCCVDKNHMRTYCKWCYFIKYNITPD